MARRNLGQGLLSDFDSEDFDISLETTVPTDLTLSEDSDIPRESRRTKSKVTKQLIERKQLIHDLQLLKIENSQKNMHLENIKADYMQRVEDLEERLNDALHQKQLLQTRLEGRMQVQQEDSRRRQEQIKQELDEILDKQRHLEEANSVLRERAGDVRRSLVDLQITEQEFLELKALPEEQLSLRQFVSVRFFELLRPVSGEVEHLRVRVRSLEEENTQTRRQLDVTEQGLSEERRMHQRAQAECQRLTLEVADAKGLLQQADYKRENYDRVKSNRDEMERDLLELRRDKGHTEATLQALTRERDDLVKQLSSMQQSSALLEQDKQYLTRQLADITRQLTLADERGVSLTAQLEDVKRAREELYDKYVSSRDQHKIEYERKLREEIDSVRMRTEAEVERLRTSSKEMYERENRSLREAREMAQSEKERSSAAEREANIKLEQLMSDYRELQMKSDTKISETQNELRVKAFELERSQLLSEETAKNLKESQLECEKLQRKLEVVSREYYQLQGTADRRATELEAALDETRRKLSVYEKLEAELDDVVMQAAQLESDTDAEKVLFSYGYGANVPSTSKRRLQQSVHLARRVLQLERKNSALSKDLETEKEKNRAITEELGRSENLLEQSQQPYSYLVEGLRTRDKQLAMLRAAVEELELQKKHLSEERTDLAKKVHQLSADLERLLNQREEMSLMKQVIANLRKKRRGKPEAQSSRGRSARSVSPRRPATPRSARSTAKSGKMLMAHRSELEAQLGADFAPGALVYTKQK